MTPHDVVACGVVRGERVSEYGITLLHATCCHGRSVFLGPVVSERGWAAGRASPLERADTRICACGCGVVFPALRHRLYASETCREHATRADDREYQRAMRAAQGAVPRAKPSATMARPGARS